MIADFKFDERLWRSMLKNAQPAFHAPAPFTFLPPDPKDVF